jgi:hypothetical protein
MLQLSNLPDQVLVPIYSEWVTVVDVGRLDSAYCNKRHRESFRSLAFDVRTLLTYPKMKIPVATRDVMNAWIYKRNVGVGGMVVTSSGLQGERTPTEYFRTHGRRMQWIAFQRVNYYREDIYWLNFAVWTMRLCPNIRQLDFTAQDSEFPSDFAADCCKLEELRIVGSIKDACIYALAERLPGLKKLAIVSYGGVSDGAIGTLLQSCQDLRSLSLNKTGDIRDSLVFSIASKCPHLTNLHLHNVFRLSTVTLAVLLTKCPNLHTLSLQSTTIYYEPAAEFPSPCSLTTLALTEVYMIDHSVAQILRGCPALEVLNLSSCKEINTDALYHIALCRRLRTLSLVSCYVTDSVLTEVGQGCGELREITVAGNVQISDGGVTALAKGCPLLQRVTLPRHCREVGDAALFALAVRCSGLRQIVVGNGVTEKGSAEVERKYAGLRITQW